MCIRVNLRVLLWLGTGAPEPTQDLAGGAVGRLGGFLPEAPEWVTLDFAVAVPHYLC